MCGIVGAYARNGNVNVEAVDVMNSLQTHRGPDDKGRFVSAHGNVCLAMTRLAIVDIVGGHQPMKTSCGRYTIVFNGQIYNHVQIRKNLEELGFQFSTRCDTEVLLNAYKHWGIECLEKLNGMFAVAIWDEYKQSLLVARDRCGIKPLYWTNTRDGVIFASELRSLFGFPETQRNINKDAIDEYLVLGYIVAPRTPFEGIYKLEPGCAIQVVQGKAPQVVRWWQPAFNEQETTLSYQDSVEQLHELIKDSVLLRMGGDEPVGAFLSGGIDSGGLTAMMAKTPGFGQLNTFTASFDYRQADEGPLARMLAEEVNSQHHECSITFPDVLKYLPELVKTLDEPISDSAVVPTWMLSKLAVNQHKAVVSGVGGDELFGGYTRYFDGKPAEHLYRLLPKGLRSKVMTKLLGGHDILGVRALMNAASPADRYLWRVAQFSAESLAMVSGSDAMKTNPLDKYFSHALANKKADFPLLVDLKTYLPDNILHLTDRISMRASLEIREPLLDYRIVDFAFSLPRNYKFDQVPTRRSKKILRDAFSRYLPQAYMTAPKRGFAGPVKHWMINNNMERIIVSLLSDSHAVKWGLIDRNGTDKYIREGARYDSLTRYNRLWSLLVLELWARIMLSQIPADSIHLEELLNYENQAFTA